jgi:Flp pilus assembly CpaE family ATPase
VTPDRPGVVLALSPVAERAVEELLFGDQSPVTVLGSVSDADELEGALPHQEVVAVLASPALSGLTSAHCERVRACGLNIVGVALDERDREALSRLPVDAVVEATASGDDLLAAMTRDDRDRPRPTPRSSAPPDAVEDGGTVIAVIGCKGAPGASECAASLAALAAKRWPALLVELDALGGALAVRIGADPRHGSLRGVVRAAQAGDRTIGELLARWISEAGGWPAALVAPTDLESALDELAAPGAIGGALRALRVRFPLTVCDVGFLLDVAPAGRIHREALVSADAVVLVVGTRDAHLQPGLTQLDLLLDTLGIAPERLRVVINGVGAPGAASQRSLDETLIPRLAERGLMADAWLPWDHRALTRAQRLGVPLVAARWRSPYRRVLAHLLDELFLPTPAAAPRSRKRRLRSPVAMAELREQEEVALPWRS